LHPALFPQLDLVSATQAFYRQFYDYSLTANDAQRILQALPPE
jgi:iron complex transport system substrate-binding protein